MKIKRFYLLVAFFASLSTLFGVQEGYSQEVTFNFRVSPTPQNICGNFARCGQKFERDTVGCDWAMFECLELNRNRFRSRQVICQRSTRITGGDAGRRRCSMDALIRAEELRDMCISSGNSCITDLDFEYTNCLFICGPSRSFRF